MECNLFMNLIALSAKEIIPLEDEINTFLKSIFSSDVKVDINEELSSGVLIINNEVIIGCGFVYVREMTQKSSNFQAAIIACVAVDESYRGKGLCKEIISRLDQQISSACINYSFLFAYEKNIYKSSGYQELKTAINYFDKYKKQWNTFVYRGGMIKSFKKVKLSKDSVINFNGCVY